MKDLRDVNYTTTVILVNLICLSFQALRHPRLGHE